MNELLNLFLAFLVVVDPIGLAPLFVALAHGMPAEQRRQTAIRGVLVATLVLVGFLFVGRYVLDALGVGMAAFRIAGGVLLFLLAIDMIFARQSGLRSTTPRERHEAAHRDDISVFPLAIPLIAGPGTMTTLLLVTSEDRGPAHMALVLAVLLAILGLTLISLLSAERIVRLIGETGSNVVSRVLGIILAALAVQYVLDGLTSGLGLTSP